MRILVTGGCGFIGHHLIEHIIKNTDWEIVLIDRLSYASRGFDRLRDISVFDEKRIRIFTHDLTLPIEEDLEREIGQVEVIVHLAASTHVDRSITDPAHTVMANVLGTLQILEFARRQKALKWLIYFSTDEIFGPAPPGVNYREWDRYNSTNPYSASKAAGEELCLAWANTYGIPLFITHTMNAFGERQHPEKFIPSTIKKVLAEETVLIHASPDRTTAGSRFWIHSRNIAEALLFLLPRAEPREKYNIVGEREVDNLSMAQFIAAVLGRPLLFEMVDFHSSRPGHDLRYALDGGKMRGMGWKQPIGFESSLTKTIRWYGLNPRWLNN